VCEITEDDLEKKLKEQGGKCFYSGIPLRTDTRAWRPSLERKDPSLGYTYDNTVLCCLEFNGPRQWTLHENLKLLAERYLDEQGNDQVELETFDIATNKRKKRTKGGEKYDADGNRLHECTHCNEFKPTTMFYEHICNGCKACQCKKGSDHVATPRGAMQLLVNHARTRTKNWQKNNDLRGGNKDFELSFVFLKTLYIKQEGRCAYSGLPFDFEIKHRKPSLERIDPLKPYTKKNVCLIWMVWNTTDTLAKTKHALKDIKPGEKQGWSKPKFEHAFSHIESKTKQEFEDAHGGPMTMDEFKTRVIAEYKTVHAK
jgi:hypothetical protein